ncbi:MAG: hypothetical protein AAFY65_16740 [Pseudomonadota bacterium]
MTDIDPWERRFLHVLTTALPEAPPAEGFLFRRSLVARMWPRAGAGTLILAAAEVLEEEGLSRARVLGFLRGALTAEPVTLQPETFWDAGRGDLMPLATAHPTRRFMVARVAVPVMAALTASVIACNL